MTTAIIDFVAVFIWPVTMSVVACTVAVKTLRESDQISKVVSALLDVHNAVQSDANAKLRRPLASRHRHPAKTKPH